MADIPTLEPAAGGAAGAAPRKFPWLIVIIATVVLLGGGGGAAWWFLGRAPSAEATKSKTGKTQAAAKQAAPAPTGPPQFVALDPPFVSNFEAEQMVRFLQVSVQIMSRDTPTVELIKANDPVIRNDLLLLFGNQKYVDISSRDGKERLRNEALATVRRIITSAGGNGERVEAVYFTSFVMQ